MDVAKCQLLVLFRGKRDASIKGLIHFFTLFLKEKLTLTPLTERSVKTNVSDKSKGVSLSEKGWLTPHEAL